MAAATTLLLAGLLIVPQGPSLPVEDPHAEVARIERLADKQDNKASVSEVRPEHEDLVGAPFCDSSCIDCESSGNAQAVSPDGKYWGLYQYDKPSWIADGGNPDTYGSAPEPEQHAVAANAPGDRWPNC